MSQFTLFKKITYIILDFDLILDIMLKYFTQNNNTIIKQVQSNQITKKKQKS